MITLLGKACLGRKDDPVVVAHPWPGLFARKQGQGIGVRGVEFLLTTKQVLNSYRMFQPRGDVSLQENRLNEAQQYLSQALTSAIQADRSPDRPT